MSSKGTKTKIILNLLLLIVIFAIIYYLINHLQISLPNCCLPVLLFWQPLLY